MHFENSVQSGQEEELNLRFAEKLSSNASIFNAEGGSGIAKVNKILRADFQNPSNELKIWAQDGVCFTEVKLYTDNLKANEQETVDN